MRPPCENKDYSRIYKERHVCYFKPFLLLFRSISYLVLTIKDQGEVFIEFRIDLTVYMTGTRSLGLMGTD